METHMEMYMEMHMEMYIRLEDVPSMIIRSRSWSDAAPGGGSTNRKKAP